MNEGNRLWVLGAQDHEMDAIEALLRGVDERVRYAEADGQRCHAGNAYRAEMPDPVLVRVVYETYQQIYEVECMVRPADRHNLQSETCITVDHHRPGDPGTGRGPQEFLAASSLGQVIAELARLGALPEGWDVYHLTPGAVDVAGDIFWRGYDNRWIVIARDSSHRCLVALMVPIGLVMTAAADHCLGAAYRGECPGVRPTPLWEFREQEKARARGVDVATVHADIQRARDALHAAPVELLGYRSDEERDADPDATGGVEVADMRATHLPELPEAACIEGIPFIAMGLPGPDGRKKVVLQAAGPDELRLWPGWAKRNGLVDLYGGDPARGFAGGYLPA